MDDEKKGVIIRQRLSYTLIPQFDVMLVLKPNMRTKYKMEDVVSMMVKKPSDNIRNKLR